MMMMRVVEISRLHNLQRVVNLQRVGMDNPQRVVVNRLPVHQRYKWAHRIWVAMVPCI